MSKKYKIIALTGAAGSGKDTLIYELMNNSENKKYFNRIIRTTTRPKREGETNGVSYHFCDKEEFLKLIKNDSLLEYNVFNNWRYGIQYKDLDINKINIGEFNPYSLREICVLPNVDVRVFWVTASDNTRLIRQLSRETNPNIEEIFRRYCADKKDFDMLYNSEIDYVEIKNEKVDDLYNATSTIINSLWDDYN